MAPTKAQLVATGHKFISEYNKFEFSAIMALRSADCVQTIYPRSLGYSPQDNVQYTEFFKFLQTMFHNFTLKVVDDSHTVVDIEKRKVTMHMSSYADTDVGPYENEYWFCLTVTEDGEQIEEILEFLDSAYTIDFLKRVEAAKQPN